MIIAQAHAKPPVTTETLSAKLTLDVRYTLNGVDPTHLLQNLRKMCEHAIENGMLTGHTESYVDEYSMDVAVAGEASTEIVSVIDAPQRYSIKPHISINADGLPCFGVSRNGMSILRPYLSTCRGPGATVHDVGLTASESNELHDLNKRTESAVKAALNAIADAYQTEFGVTHSAVAGRFFSNRDNAARVYSLVLELIQQEYSFYDKSDLATERHTWVPSKILLPVQLADSSAEISALEATKLPPGTIGDAMVAFPLFCEMVLDRRIFEMLTSDACAQSCMKVLETGHLLADLCADTRPAVIDAIQAQVNVFYFG